MTTSAVVDNSRLDTGRRCEEVNMQTSDWIKPSERLPEDGEEVLAWVPVRLMDCTPGPRILVWEANREKWVEDDAVLYLKGDVTYWMSIVHPE